MSFPRGMIPSLMQTLGYISDLGGICYGLSHMAVQAFFADDIDTFIKRLEIIRNKKNEFFTKEEWENRFRVLDAKKINHTITSDELIELEIRPFFDGIELYFQGYKYPEFFEKRKTPVIQDAILSAPLVNSIILEEAGQKGESFAEVLSFSGTYKHDDLVKYFTSLKETIDAAKFDQPVPIVLLSGDHAITIAYIPGKSQWYCIDPGDLQLTPTDDISSIAKAVIDGFTDNDCAVFATKLYATKKNEDRIKKVAKVWTSHESWEKIHEPNQDKAQNDVDSRKWSWLHLASTFGHVDEIDKLIEAKADVNQHSASGKTPLYKAVEARRFEAAKKLLKARADVNKTNTDNDQNTSLFIAAQLGYVELVNELLQQGALVDKSNNHDVTPLLVATQVGHFDIVMQLINAKANVNHLATSKGDLTALYFAAESNHLEIADELIKAGADVNHVNNRGMSALSIAAANGNLNMVIKLIKASANLDHEGTTALYTAALNGHLHIVETMLEFGAKVDSVTAQGNAPLFAAAEKGHLDVVVKLLGSGAEANHANKTNATALHIAAQTGHLAVVEKLILAGADIHLETSKGTTPLIAAILGKHWDVVEKLIAANVNINQVTSQDMTALWVAAEHENLNFIEKLVAAGADVNYEKDGDSLLFTAASRGQLDLVEKLIACKANINQENNDYMTPLHVALNSKHIAIVELLLKNGATFYEDYCNKATFPSIQKFIKACLFEKCTDQNLKAQVRANKLTVAELAREMKYEALANFLISYQAKETDKLTSAAFFKKGENAKVESANQSTLSEEPRSKKMAGL